MIEKIVTCKVVTPIISKGLGFMQSGDHKIYHFELRPQSIKGVLHFWFRAVAPRIIDVRELNFENVKDEELRKIYGNLEYKGLRYFESLIFGSQEQKAPFGLGVQYNSNETIEIGRIEDGKLRVENQEFDKDILYALYGTYYATKRPNDNFVEKCLKSGSSFKLRFWVRDEDTWRVIVSLLKIVSVLGGFGAKTTKGFGQFEITQLDDEPKFDRSKYVTDREIQELLKETECVLKNYIEKFDENNLLILRKSTQVDFPNLLDESFNFSKSLVSPPRSNWKEVMKELYRQFGFYRQLKRDLRYLNKDGQKDTVKKLINCLNGFGREVTVFPAVLGMPLQYQRLKCKIKKVIFFPYVPGEKGNKGRKPSPLRIIINRDKNGWTAYALLLKSKVTNDERLEHDSKAAFQAKLTITVDDLKKKTRLKDYFEQGEGVNQ